MIQTETDSKVWSDFDDDFFGSDEEDDEFFKDDNNEPRGEKKTDFKKKIEEDECDMTNNPGQFGYFLGLYYNSTYFMDDGGWAEF